MDMKKLVLSEEKLAPVRAEIEDLFKNHPDCTIILMGIVGSTAYGTNTEKSDIDIKGVYIQNLDSIMRDDYNQQISNEKNDINFYELGKFFDLVRTNNPNILEMLNLPQDCILYKDPSWKMLEDNIPLFISKRCEDSFAKYAESQIKKAKGMNKKINNPMEKERKTPLHFCYALDHINGKSYELIPWMEKNGYEQKFFGAVNVPHADGIYALYYDWNAHFLFSNKYDTVNQSKVKQAKKIAGESLGMGYKGLINPEDLNSNTIRLSSIPKNQESIGLMYYNQNGYTQYCKAYREYWKWVEDRNEVRYNTNMEHGQGYDSKNMMHCIRLLEMCYEIATEKKIIVRRPNREELLSIRSGSMPYETILSKAEDLMYKIKLAFEISDLREVPDQKLLKDLLSSFRKKYYRLEKIKNI